MILTISSVLLCGIRLYGSGKEGVEIASLKLDGNRKTENSRISFEEREDRLGVPNTKTRHGLSLRFARSWTEVTVELTMQK